MRKFLSLILLLAAVPSFAVTKNKPFQEYNFSKGLDSYHNSQSLSEGYVQDSNNVLFDDKTPIDKRAGYTFAWAANASTAIVITTGFNDNIAIRMTGSDHPVTLSSGTFYTPLALATAINLAIASQTVFLDSFTYSAPFFVFNSTISGHSLDTNGSTDLRNTATTLGFTPPNFYIVGGAGPQFSVTAPSAPVTSNTGPAIQALWTYTDATNVTWQIARSSSQLTANNLAGTSVVVATVSANNIVGEVNAFGNAYFVDQTQGVYFWNGISSTFVAGSPKGSIITQFHGRLWVSGLAVPNGNQLYSSGYFAGTTWTTGLNPTDPVQLSIGLQDNFDNITAEYVYLDTLYVFKHSSIFALYGFDQTSFQISQLTQECGCLDGGSIQTYASGLKFVSLRGVESFDGYTCKRISDPIKNKIDPAISVRSFSSQSWVQSQTTDWTAGTIVSLDTTTYAPAIALDNPSQNIPNGSFENSFSSWTAQTGWTTSGSVTGSFQYQFSCANGCLNCSAFNGGGTLSPSDGSFMALSSETYSSASSSMSIQVVYSTNTSSVIVSQNYFLTGTTGFISQSTTTLAIPSSAYGNSVQIIITDGVGSTLTSIPYTITGTSISFVVGAVVNGSANATCSTTSGTIYWVVDAINMNVGIISFSSGTFQSQIHSIGSITNWGNFSVQDSLSNGGAISFSVCSSTNSNMSAPFSCAAQTPNSQISISTGTYVQWYATFTVTSATQTPTLNSATVQWFAQSLVIPMTSTVWDNRYWLALTTTTQDSANDAVLVLDQAGAWAVFDIHAGGLTQYKNSLYHGDSLATGNIYLDNQGFSDNGFPINAYVRTRTFGLGDFASDDYLYAVYPSALNTGNCLMSVSYRMDGNANGFILGSPLLSEFSTLSAVRLPFPIDSSHQDFGQTIDFFFGTDDGQCDWQFYGMEGLYKNRPIQ